MINGRVNWLLEATIYIEIEDASGILYGFQCILDTGFDGENSLPSGAIRLLGLVSSGHRPTILGNDEIVDMETFYATVSWLGSQMNVSALQADGEPAIGMGLLENSTLSVQVWEGGNVQIEPR